LVAGQPGETPRDAPLTFRSDEALEAGLRE